MSRNIRGLNTTTFEVPEGINITVSPSAVVPIIEPPNIYTTSTGQIIGVPAGSGLTISRGADYRATDGSVIYRPAGAIIPVGWTIILTTTTTTGTVWTTPSGGVVHAKPGSTIPPNWVPSSIPYDDSKAFTSEYIIPTASQDGWYINPATGEVKVIKKGERIPPEWRTATVDQIPEGTTEVAVAAASGTWDVATREEHVAGFKKKSTTYYTEIIAGIIGAVGVLGVSYIGYLYVTNPQEITTFISRFDQLKSIVVDTAVLSVAIATIVGISFVSYEFLKAYEITGTITGAIGSLTADTIEVLISAIVEAAETLFLDAWSAIKSFLDNWHPFSPF
jgi:hypothetical protein